MPTPAPESFDTALRRELAAGWVVVSDGPSGVQLRKPKHFDWKYRLMVLLGLFTLAWGGYLIWLLVALRWFTQKEETQFLMRPPA